MTKSVLFITNSAYSLSGLATWLDYLLPGLRDIGWDVTLGLVSGRRHHRPDRYLSVHPFPKTVSIHCSSSTARGRVDAVRKTIRNLQPDIVLTVNIPDAILAAALERSAGRNVRAVMSCHGIQEDLFADMRCLGDELDAVVCTNELACRLAEQLGSVPPQRTFHCAYGTPVPDRVPARPNNATFTIGYSGRLEQPQKRIHDLVAIADNIRTAGREFQFLVAGNGPEEQAFQDAVQQHGLTDRFRMLGFVPLDQLEDRLYRSVDALLVTSSWETGPIVIWEAMAAGAPVVTSRYTGSGQERLLWHQQNCLMFEIGDCEDAARQLMTLQDDTQQCQQINERAFETVTDRLSCEVSVANWDVVLNRLLQTEPRGGTIIPAQDSPTSGRLSRLLGERWAAIARRLLRRMPPDTGPGGEWPHTIAGSTMNQDAFFELAAKLDAREALPDHADSQLRRSEGGAVQT